MPPPRFETRLYRNTRLRGLGIVLLAAAGLLCLGAAFKAATARGPIVALLGIALLFFATHTLFSARDFAIDLAGRRYRHFSTLFGLKLGQWQPLPAVDGVVLKYFSAYTAAAGNGRAGWGIWEPGGPQRSYIIMLSGVEPDNTAILVFKLPFREKEQAALIAAQLGKYLAVPVHTFDIAG